MPCINQLSLVDRNGELYILNETSNYYEPKLSFAFYPTGIKTCDFRRTYGDPHTVIVEETRDPGRYRLTDPAHRDWKLEIWLSDVGKTVPRWFEEVSAPAPKMRGNIETRWQSGRWEKRLKKGWVLA